MLSISSSCFFSRALLCASTVWAAAERFILSTTLLSFSRNLTAYHLFFSSETELGRTLLTSATAPSSSSEKISFGRSISDFLATFTASSISLSSPSPFSADVSIIGQSSSIESLFTSILIPLFARRSAMFSAITTGTPVSIS